MDAPARRKDAHGRPAIPPSAKRRSAKRDSRRRQKRGPRRDPYDRSPPARRRRSASRPPGVATSGPARRERPVIQVEDDVRLIAIALAPRELGAPEVLSGDRTDAQRADVAPGRQRRRLDDFAPGEQSVAGEQRR